MFRFCVLVGCLVVLPLGQGEPRTVARRYKPIIQVTEEIDINDITFTTSAPEFERSSSHKAAYYSGTKPEVVVKGRLSDTSPNVFYRDAAGQPLVVPVTKYKPYKVFKVQDGFRPVSYRPKGHEKSKLVATAATTFGAPETSKQTSSKIVPFPSAIPVKAPARVAGYTPDKNFIPSPTFSPTVLALINNENNHKFTETPDVSSFTPQKTVEWTKPTKKPSRIKVPKKLPESSQQQQQRGQEFLGATEKLQEPPAPYTFQKEAPQQSESFLSEISALHNDGSAANNLDGVADTLDLKTGERVEFQMYGMDGPQSYKFGFDTGKGHNRHFRFEERDNTGKVKGHYGYLDEDGKMRIMKYEADPITGFHAGPVEISPDDN